MAANLRDIRKFPDLIRYLEAELGWPVEQSSFDDLTFEYVPAELGLKEEEAVAIKKIHQLRPLASGQPWGVFFVEFEKKNLPVVVLRRILSHLVIKKRNSANKSDRAAWNPHDLLFISAFGEESSDQREIAFAHFHQEDGDLPTLRVLGWDGADTVLKLDHVAGELRDKLCWPQDSKDHAAWREQWSRAFRHRIGHVIRTSDALAETLAALARRIRGAAQTMMAHESANGPLTKLYKAFQAALIHDLTEESFADTYAQTITYGLLTAAISRTEMSAGTAGTFVRANDISDIVPVTNPFLKEMLQMFLTAGGRKGGIDFDELGVQDVVELLRGDETDLPAILRDFGNKTRGEDPVIHFYEHFLSAYNKKLKIQRGVFYTPKPVVSYIVRSVHEQLQTEFGLEDGLASTVTWHEMLQRHKDLKLPTVNDPNQAEKTISPDELFVQILDPATGTATFLVEATDVIFNHLKVKWEKGGLKAMPKLPPSSFPRQPSAFGEYWNQYVPLALLPRLHGYELMMAPYAIAHMKIGLKLHETGYHFGSEERARIYLTNALEPKVNQLPQIGFEPLAHEAQAVNEIKWYKRFTVVIGNPPYSILSANLTETAMALVDEYRHIDGVKVKEKGALKAEVILQDDYIKFMRCAEIQIERAGLGVFGQISNHAYLDNPTLRALRWHLLQTFNKIAVLDLHGNTRKREVSPQGSDDKNVFDIQQGVAIVLFLKQPFTDESKVTRSELWGDRESKYEFLRVSSLQSTQWLAICPEAPFFLFVSQDAEIRSEFSKCISIMEAMPKNAVGTVTGRDQFAIDFDKDELLGRLEKFCDPSNTDSQIREMFGIRDAGGYMLSKRRPKVLGTDPNDYLQTVQYRPFDYRWIGFSRGFLTSDQSAVMEHLLNKTNLALAIGRAGQVIDQGPWNILYCSRNITEFNLYRRGGHNLFPLYLVSDAKHPQAEFETHSQERLNFSPAFLKTLADTLGLLQKNSHSLPDGVTPEDIFHYAYGVFHSPGYRSRYAEFLKIDFPRLPLTANLELFRSLAGLGGELTALHLLESPKLEKPITEYLGGRSPVMEKVSWSKNTVWLDKEQTIGFQGVREDVWNFHIGGYQVCEKWLKDRKGRPLSAADREHYQKIVVALSETIRLMQEIDAVIEKHGSWPLK